MIPIHAGDRATQEKYLGKGHDFVPKVSRNVVPLCAGPSGKRLPPHPRVLRGDCFDIGNEGVFLKVKRAPRFPEAPVFRVS